MLSRLPAVPKFINHYGFRNCVSDCYNKGMKRYIVLLRGVNVGGKNKVSMAELRTCLEELGYDDVSTYINSGNVLLTSAKSAEDIKDEIEKALIKRFKLDSELIEVLVLSRDQLRAVVDTKPKGFGDKPDMYHSDVIFLIDTSSDDAIKIFKPREGVDTVWAGNGVIYSQRLSAERTKSRLNAIIGTPVYKKMTIRNWNTTMKLLSLSRGDTDKRSPS